MPLLGLGRVFGEQPGHRPPAGRRPVVIVRSGDELLALEVDSLLGRQEVLVKPMASYVGEVGHLAGATVLDDGRIAFIADVPSLVARASQRDSRAA